MSAKATQPYSLHFTKAAKRDIKRLKKHDRQVLASIDAAIKALASNPRPHGVKHLGGDRHRVRVGDYRIIYRIDDGKRETWVTRIRGRKDVYKH